MLNCRHDLVAIILICCINVANKSPDVASSNQLNSDVVSRSWVCWVIYKSFWKKPVKRIRQVTLICSTWTVAWLPFFAIFLNMIRAPAFLILYGKKFTITNQFIFSRINVFLVWHWRRFASLLLRILRGKRHLQIKLQRFRKAWIWTFEWLIHQINPLWEVLKRKWNFQKK